MANALHAHMTEDQLKEKVIARAKARGWRIHHDRPARIKDGDWRTPVQGHKGFPDLVLARDGRVIFAELKSETGRLGEGQIEWLQALTARWDRREPDSDADQQEVYVWRPSDWSEIERTLE